MKGLNAETPTLPVDTDLLIYYEAAAHRCLGKIALHEENEETIKEALIHFEKQLELCEAIGNARCVFNAKYNLAKTKSILEGIEYKYQVDEETLRASQDDYESNLAEYGEDHASTISSGKSFAFMLTSAHRLFEKAQILLTQLFPAASEYSVLITSEPRVLNRPSIC
jgi:hypothetical protein